MKKETRVTRDWLQERLSEYVDCIENHAYDDATKVQEAILAALNADTERINAIEAFLNMKSESKVELFRFPTPTLVEHGVNHHVACYGHGFMSTSGETLREAIDEVLVPLFRRTTAGRGPSSEDT